MSTNFDSNKQIVETIKDRVSIVDIVSRYVTLSAGGKNMKGCCPLHGEKTPSFYVSPQEGYWKCFGCGKGGDVFSFIQEIEKISFKESLVYLAEIAGVELNSRHSTKDESKDSLLYALMKDAKDYYHSILQKNLSVIEYLNTRGVTRETIDKFMLGYAPDAWQTLYDQYRKKYTDDIFIESGIAIQGKRGLYDRFRSRILFPTIDVRGRVITFSGRIWSQNGEYQTERQDAGKYVNGPETEIYHKSRTLYGLDLARQVITQKNRVVVVEGHLDCVMAHQAGIGETVAIAGTSFTEEHAAILSRYTDRAVLSFDGDSAGHKATVRTIPILYSKGFTVDIAVLPEGSDPADTILYNKRLCRNQA
jgi:DNA primase